MSAALLGYIPGEIFFGALKDGEPLAYVVLLVVVTAIIMGFVIKNSKSKLAKIN
jgi:hypothetical protein